jgi:hypothetical protein
MKNADIALVDTAILVPVKNIYFFMVGACMITRMP